MNTKDLFVVVVCSVRDPAPSVVAIRRETDAALDDSGKTLLEWDLTGPAI